MCPFKLACFDRMGGTHKALPPHTTASLDCLGEKHFCSRAEPASVLAHCFYLKNWHTVIVQVWVPVVWLSQGLWQSEYFYMSVYVHLCKAVLS